MTAEVQRLSVQYPGGFAARYRWAGSGQADEVFGISEAAGTLNDFGTLADPHPDRQCRAELRIEGPTGHWTARFASQIFDAPDAVLVDTAGLLIVRYGFLAYGLDARTGELRWSYKSGTPTVAIFWPLPGWTTPSSRQSSRRSRCGLMAQSRGEPHIRT